MIEDRAWLGYDGRPCRRPSQRASRDCATRAWIAELYGARLEGASTAESMRRAAVRVLTDRRAAGASTHPFYWGAFEAAGDWR
jgi:hypothetical protein